MAVDFRGCDDRRGLGLLFNNLTRGKDLRVYTLAGDAIGSQAVWGILINYVDCDHVKTPSRKYSRDVVSQHTEVQIRYALVSSSPIKLGQADQQGSSKMSVVIKPSKALMTQDEYLDLQPQEV